MDSPLLHVANVLYLFSYSVRDMLWLRVLTVMAMICLGWCYFLASATGALAWQVAFLIVNLIQIAWLIHERRPVQLDDRQRRLHSGPLRSLSARQVQRFTEKAQWCSADDADQLLVEDSKSEFLILVYSGHCRVIAGGKEIAKIVPGQFIGEMSLLTGGRISADVLADGGVRFARWPTRWVNDLIDNDQELGSAVQAALGINVVEKLLESRAHNAFDTTNVQ